MNVLVEPAQNNLAHFSPYVMLVQTVIAVLLFAGAGTVIRLAYHQWAVASSPTEDDDRALLSRSRVRPVSRTAFPVAGVDSGRAYVSPTVARPRAPVLSPLALINDEAFSKGRVNDNDYNIASGELI